MKLKDGGKLPRILIQIEQMILFLRQFEKKNVHPRTINIKENMNNNVFTFVTKWHFQRNEMFWIFRS